MSTKKLAVAMLVTLTNLHAQPAIITLEPGRTIERELSGGETHSFELYVEQGQYARIVVEQQGIDVFVKVADAGNALEFDGELRLRGAETAELVAESTGVYKLEVHARYRSFPTAKYTLTVAELRPASERERALHTARRVTAESQRLQLAGKHAAARPLAQEALQIIERQSGDNRREVASAAQNLGVLCYEQGDYACAEEHTKRALSLREETVGSEHPDVALSLNRLGNIQFRREDYTGAITLQQRALAILDKALDPNHPAIAGALLNLGINYRRLGDLVSAEAMYLRALSIQERVLGPEHRNFAVVANNLGLLYTAKEDHAKAKPMYLKAIAVMEKTLGPEHPDLRSPLINLANVYTSLGQYEDAETLYVRLLTAVEATPNRTFTALVLTNFGTCMRLKGEHTRAAQLYGRALEVREAASGRDHPSVARLLNLVAINAEIMGELATAIAAEQRAAEIMERELTLNLAIGSERQKLAYFDLLSHRTDEILSLTTGAAARIPQAIELGATVVLQRKGRVQDAIAGNLAALHQRMSAEGKRLFDEWKGTSERLASLVLSEPKEGLPAYEKSLRTLQQTREDLESRLNRDSSAFQRSRPVSISAVQAALPHGAALVEFAVYRRMNPLARIHDDEFGPQRYAAFVIRPDTPVYGTDLGEAAEIDKAIAAFREALRSPKRRDVDDLARGLDEIVVQPFRGALDGVSRLLISPDGALNLVPFAAFRDQQGRYVAERYPITYLTSGRDLLRSRDAGVQASANPPLILADPAFDAPVASQIGKSVAHRRKSANEAKARSVTSGADLSSIYFAPLVGASKEAEAIAAVFPASTMLTGARATKESLNGITPPKILHIATHGFFLDDQTSKASSDDSTMANPLLRSGLALAGANVRTLKGRAGILTALEASGLNLYGTKLVTLSACDTGLGEVKNGEGVYGFRRALVLAGAETLVMSLWPVSDQVTRELMTAYYTALKNGDGRGDGLRQVQLKMMKRADRRHPFYWSSFIQSGEWGNLDGRR